MLFAFLRLHIFLKSSFTTILSPWSSSTISCSFWVRFKCRVAKQYRHQNIVTNISKFRARFTIRNVTREHFQAIISHEENGNYPHANNTTNISSRLVMQICHVMLFNWLTMVISYVKFMQQTLYIFVCFIFFRTGFTFLKNTLDVSFGTCFIFL